MNKNLVDYEKELRLPKNDTGEESIKFVKNLALLGENGSGKTRLGIWLEKNNNLAYRISAQKSLAMPQLANIGPVKQADELLLQGGISRHKTSHNYEQLAVSSTENDFNKLIDALMSEHFYESAKYRDDAKKIGFFNLPMPTRLEKLKKIFEKILPYIRLSYQGIKLSAENMRTQEGEYSVSDMSDGERAIFYLIGKCLTFPEKALIIVDEPELYIHESIRRKLWEEIEEERPDCFFIYLTHDLNFARTHTSSRIWIKTFHGSNRWNWTKIATSNVADAIDDPAFPSDLLIQILGTRLPILLIEGQKSSLDIKLFRKLYPNFNVIPAGGCEEVISSVRELRKFKSFHRLDVYGIVDRDHRDPEEIANLASKGVFVLGVAEIESIFCTPDLLLIIAEHLKISGLVEENNDCNILEQATGKIFEQLRKEIQVQISIMTKRKINRERKNFDKKQFDSEQDCIDQYNALNTIDVSVLYKECHALFYNILESQDYVRALQFYNCKGLLYTLSLELFDLKGEQLINVILHLIDTKYTDIRTAIARYIPDLEKLIPSSNTATNLISPLKLNQKSLKVSADG